MTGEVQPQSYYTGERDTWQHADSKNGFDRTEGRRSGPRSINLDSAPMAQYIQHQWNKTVKECNTNETND